MKALVWLLAVFTLAQVGQARAEETPNVAVESARALVDLNHADEAALLDLPGIGQTRAHAIITYREAHGGFRSLSQLLHVKGIGRSLLKRLRPLVTI